MNDGATQRSEGQSEQYPPAHPIQETSILRLVPIVSDIDSVQVFVRHNSTTIYNAYAVVGDSEEEGGKTVAYVSKSIEPGFATFSSGNMGNVFECRLEGTNEAPACLFKLAKGTSNNNNTTSEEQINACRAVENEYNHMRKNFKKDDDTQLFVKTFIGGYVKVDGCEANGGRSFGFVMQKGKYNLQKGLQKADETTRMKIITKVLSKIEALEGIGHGDLHYGNVVILGDDDIVFIDPWPTRAKQTGLPNYDLIYFLLSMVDLVNQLKDPNPKQSNQINTGCLFRLYTALNEMKHNFFSFSDQFIRMYSMKLLQSEDEQNEDRVRKLDTILNQNNTSLVRVLYIAKIFTFISKVENPDVTKFPDELFQQTGFDVKNYDSFWKWIWSKDDIVRDVLTTTLEKRLNVSLRLFAVPEDKWVTFSSMMKSPFVLWRVLVGSLAALAPSLRYLQSLNIPITNVTNDKEQHAMWLTGLRTLGDRRKANKKPPEPFGIICKSTFGSRLYVAQEQNESVNSALFYHALKLVRVKDLHKDLVVDFEHIKPPHDDHAVRDVIWKNKEKSDDFVDLVVCVMEVEPALVGNEPNVKFINNYFLQKDWWNQVVTLQKTT